MRWSLLAVSFFVATTFRCGNAQQDVPEGISIDNVREALDAFSDLSHTLHDFDVFEKPLVLIGSSVEHLLHETSIHEVFDLQNVPLGNGAAGENTIAPEDLREALSRELDNRADDVRPWTDREGSNVCAGANAIVRVEHDADRGATEIYFCAIFEFKGQTNLAGPDLADSLRFFPGSVAVSFLDRRVDVSVKIGLSVKLSFGGNENDDPVVEWWPLAVDVEIENVSVPVSVLVGMVEIQATAILFAEGKFSISYVEPQGRRRRRRRLQEEEEGTPTQAPATSPSSAPSLPRLVNQPLLRGQGDCECQCVALVEKDDENADSGFRVDGCMRYEITSKTERGGSDITLLTSLPGLQLKTQPSFRLRDENIFDPNPLVRFDLGFDDVEYFGPHNALALVRLLNNTLASLTRNEALEDVRVPLTKTTLANALDGAAPALSAQLLDFFAETQPLAEGDEPLRLVGTFSPTTLVNDDDDQGEPVDFDARHLEFWYLPATLTVNPAHSLRVRDLVGQNGRICPLDIDKEPSSASDYAEKLREGIDQAKCGVRVCELPKKDDDDDEYEDYNPNCDIFVGTNKDDDQVTILSGFRANGRPKNVQLMGLYKNVNADKDPPANVPHYPQSSLLGFPVNIPDYPLLIPTFRTFDEFTQRINNALQAVPNLSDIGIAVVYVPPQGDEYGTISFDIKFDSTTDLDVRFDASGGLGDLIDVSSDSEIALKTRSTLETEIGVFFGTSNDTITLISTACKGEGFVCDGIPRPDFLVDYRMDGSDIEQTLKVSLDQDEPNVATALANSPLAQIATVTDKGKSTLIIRFNPDILTADIWTSKDCSDPRDESKEPKILEKNVLECPLDMKAIFLSNAYGLQDTELRKPSFQLGLGQSRMQSSFDIQGRADIRANVGGVIRATVDLGTQISGDLTLTAGIDNNLIPATDWISAMANILRPDRVKTILNETDFFNVNFTFDGELDGLLDIDPGVDIFENEEFPMSISGRFVEPFEVNLLNEQERVSFPVIYFDIDLPGLVSIPELNFSNVIDALAKSLEVLVGDGTDDTVDSCSGGIIGSAVGGNPVFNYQIPVLGVSGCSAVRFLQTLVQAIDRLRILEDDDPEVTLSSLKGRLIDLLTDGIGEIPKVDVYAEERSILKIEIEKSWSFQEKSALTMDMRELFQSEETEDKAIDVILRDLSPASSGKGEFEVDSALILRLGVGVEVVKNGSDVEITSFIMGGTGLAATFEASGSIDFPIALGPLTGSVEADFEVGSEGDPIVVSAFLDSETNFYLEQVTDIKEGFQIVNGVSGLTEEVNGMFGGSMSATLDFDLPLLGFQAFVNFSIPEFNAFFVDPSSPTSIILKFEVSDPDFSPPTFIDLLLMDPLVLVDTLEDLLLKTEDATLGANGIVSSFPVPFLRNGLASALGVNTANNVLGRARRQVVSGVRNGLNDLAASNEEQRPDTVGEALALLLEEALLAIDFIREENSVLFECFQTTGGNAIPSSVDCESGDITSIMWTVPLGQNSVINLPLDFSLDPAFPLEIALGSDPNETPTLEVGWSFKLAFGFDEREGFFLQTFPDEDGELFIEALLEVQNVFVKANLFFLEANFPDIDLLSGASFSLDINKATGLRLDGPEEEGPQYGRLTATDFKRIVRLSDLFEAEAVAGATIEATGISVGLDLDDKVDPWIPKLAFEIAAQVRREQSFVSPTRSRARALRASGSQLNRRLRYKVGTLHENSLHRAAPLLRSLRAVEGNDLLQDDFSFPKCPVNVTVEDICARVLNVEFNFEEIANILGPIVGKLVNGKDGSLDSIVRPFDKLRKPIPGISELAGRDITVIDIAEIFVGPEKSGADTLRTIFEIYDGIKKFAETVTEGTILLAEECDVKVGFKCTGGLSGGEEERDDSELTEQQRKLQATCSSQFQDDCDDGDCDLCGGSKIELAKCKKRELTCRGRFQGLRIPWLEEPLELLRLLQNQDITLLEFTPPEVTFTFTFSQSFVIYTPPLVELEIGFEFAASVKPAFVLDTKGIRQAVEQDAPSKALNSFALKDTFEGVDLPLARIRGGVTVGLSASAVIVRASASGGVDFVLDIDLFDPYPTTSGGLVRPFELLTAGRNPLEWFEFEIAIFLRARVSISIGIYLGFIKITFFTLSESFSKKIFSLRVEPKKPAQCISFDSATGELSLKGEVATTIDCTALEGVPGNEEVECVCETRDGETIILSFRGVSKLTDPGDSDYSFILRGYQGEAALGGKGPVELDWASYGDTILSDNLIEITEAYVIAGLFELDLEERQGGASRIIDLPEPERKIFLPEPESPFLTTEFESGCNKAWELQGHSNVIVKASEVQSGCNVVAGGGDSTNAKLTIDFGAVEEDTGRVLQCSHGNKVILDREDDQLHVIVVRRDAGGQNTEFTIQVGPSYTDIELIMTHCDDEVELHGTPERSGSVSIVLLGGDDVVLIGSSPRGLDDIFKDIIIEAGNGFDSLFVDDSKSTTSKRNSQLSSSMISGMLPSLDNSVGYSDFQNLLINLTSADSFFVVNSTAVGTSTTVQGGPVNDDFLVLWTRGPLELRGGQGKDFFKVIGLGRNSTTSIFGEDEDDVLFVNGTNVIRTSNPNATDFNSTESNSTDFNTTEPEFEEMVVNNVDGSRLRWSGGEGNDELEAVFVSLGMFQLDVFEDLVGINTITLDCIRKNCSVLFRENFIANVGESNLERIDIERVLLVDPDMLDPETFTTDTNINDDVLFKETAVVSGVLLRLNEGNNSVHCDDTFSPVTVFGGPGRNEFHVGQLLPEARPISLIMLNSTNGTNTTNSINLDRIRTTISTIGVLSDGASFPLSLYGQSNEDLFDILRCKDLLLLGPSGNATEVVVRSTLIESSPNDGGSKKNQDRGLTGAKHGVSGRQLRKKRKGKSSKGKMSSKGKSKSSEISGCNGSVGLPGGDKDDDGIFPNFVLNSAISIIGKNAPRVVVAGSEADDTFLVKDREVRGGGLSVDFYGIADLRIDSGNGRDFVTVLSTDPSVVTGVHRSEDVKVIPRDIKPVVSRNLLGHSGVVEHSIASNDKDYDDLLVQGVTAGILDDDGLFAYIHILEDEAMHIMSESGLETFSFFVFPTQIPEGTVVVSFQSPVDLEGIPHFLLNGDGPIISLAFSDSEPQEVRVSLNEAVRPLSEKGVHLIQGTVITGQSTDERFIATEQSIKPVRVTVLPELLEQGPSVFIIEPSGKTELAEGESGFNATYEIILRPCTEELANETAVVIKASVPDQLTIDIDVIVGELWGVEDGCKATVSLIAIDDNEKESQHFVTLFHWVRNVSSVANTTEDILAAFEEVQGGPSPRRPARRARQEMGMKSSSKGMSKSSKSARTPQVISTPTICPPPPLVPPPKPDAPTVGTDVVRADGSVLALPSIVARIYDDDSAGIMVQERFRGISLVETKESTLLPDPRLSGSEYLVRLTKQPQSTVRLNIESDATATYPVTEETAEQDELEEIVQVAVDVASLFFTQSNWDEWQPIQVAAEFDAETEGTDLYLMASQLKPLSQEYLVIPGTGAIPGSPNPSSSKGMMMSSSKSSMTKRKSSRRALSERTLRRKPSKSMMMSSKGKSSPSRVTCVPVNCPPVVPDVTSAIQGTLEIDDDAVDDVPQIALPLMLPTEVAEEEEL